MKVATLRKATTLFAYTTGVLLLAVLAVDALDAQLASQYDQILLNEEEILAWAWRATLVSLAVMLVLGTSMLWRAKHLTTRAAHSSRRKPDQIERFLEEEAPQYSLPPLRGMALDYLRMNLSRETNEVLGAYGEVLAREKEAGNLVSPESVLPFPKERIRRALHTALDLASEEALRFHLEATLYALDSCFARDEELPHGPIRDHNVLSAWLCGRKHIPGLPERKQP